MDKVTAFVAEFRKDARGRLAPRAPSVPVTSAQARRNLLFHPNTRHCARVALGGDRAREQCI
jgi:hypothetical protein